MTKTIIFDFDGTIVDSRDLIIQLYNEIAERENYKKINKSDIESLSTLPILERCKVLDAPIHKIPSMLLEARKNYKNEIHTLRVKDGVLELLYKLKESGFSLGIISSNARSTIIEFLKQNNIDVFDYVHSAKNLFGKHYSINGLVKSFNLDKKDTIYVGDEVRDIEACKKSHIKIIAVTWGYDSTKLLQKGNPEYLINKPDEIIDIVNNNIKLEV